MNNSAAHSKLVNEILVALSRAGVLCWKQHQGRVLTLSGKPIKVGLNGAGDINAILPPRGRFASIDAKTGSGVQSDKQEKFQKAVEKQGGLYLVARSVEDALELVEQERNQ